MIGYRLLRDGQIVYTFRSEWTNFDGTPSYLTYGEVGNAGQVYKDLAPHVVEAIDRGEMDDIYEIVELPDIEPQEEYESEPPDVPAEEPTPPRRRSPRSSTTEIEES